MSVEQICLKIKRGDSWSRTLCFEYHPSHALIDITGWTIFFTVKTSAEDPDSAAIISKIINTFSNPIGGEAELSLTPTDTNQEIRSYVFDLQVKTNNNEIYTVLEGLLTITQDVTQNT
jgi:hypothetical protein